MHRCVYDDMLLVVAVGNRDEGTQARVVDRIVMSRSNRRTKENMMELRGSRVVDVNEGEGSGSN